MALKAGRPSKGDETRAKIMRDVTESGEKTKRLNADIEETLHARIKMRAAKEGRSISDITRELWVEYLSKNSFE